MESSSSLWGAEVGVEGTLLCEGFLFWGLAYGGSLDGESDLWVLSWEFPLTCRAVSHASMDIIQIKK
jgi:hypothetical protein